MQPHIVYLANSSGLKVGITRLNQVPTRWIDQGAIQAIPLLSVSSRYMSGLVEDALREWLPDKTNWRKMLKHEVEEMDLVAERVRVKALAEEKVAEIDQARPDDSLSWLDDPAMSFTFPSLGWPTKVKTYNLDKDPIVDDRLIAIKGQYLIFEQASLNVRKYTSYNVSLAITSE